MARLSAGFRRAVLAICRVNNIVNLVSRFQQVRREVVAASCARGEVVPEAPLAVGLWR